MKKFNKNLYKLLILILLFLISTTTVMAVEVTTWNYKKTGLINSQGPFTDRAACQADLAIFKISNPLVATTDCVSSVDVKTVTTQTTETVPVLIDAKVNVIENKSIYNMLAPIGGIERMDSSGTDPTCAADPKCITNDIGKYLNIIFKLAIGICAALAVIMLIINGVKYMGDESVFGKTEAKKNMFGAIVGLLIALGAWALLNTINPDLTGKNGLNISSANIELENEPVPWSTYEKGDNKNACPSGYVDVATGATPTSINVCSTISKNLSDLIAAAKKDGYTLSGTGSRKTSTTQALRVKNNCPDPKTPSSQCKPNAVAIPGNSNHEKGLAVDFNCNGKSMQPDKINTNNVCYVWLTKNAGTYGFKNNFSALKETWHWSTTGN
jgi:hypothetical protein